MAFEPPGSDGALTRQEFAAGCSQHGFCANHHEITEIFNLLDVENEGKFEMEDVMFLETDKKRREGAINKAKTRSQREHENLLAAGFREDARQHLAPKHRLAQREWHAASLERLPALVHEKRMLQQRNAQVRLSKARGKFLQHLYSVYGNGVRAWRCGLDPDLHFTMTRADLGRYCRKANVDIDLACLWKALDQHDEGKIHVQDIGPQCAAVLAKFRDWSCKHYGTCIEMWDQLRSAVAPSNKWKSDKKLLSGAFMTALSNLNWPGVDNTHEGMILCAGLDFYGCGLISRHDMEWLDAWDAPQWLCVQPDHAAWMQLRSLMLRRYGQPLRAWRTLLDQNDSNLVSWAEFQDACKRIRFNGNIGGAWRHLDVDVSGGISLQEYDEPSAHLLTSFKEWIETHWGSVEFAFRTIDTDGSGAVTFSELKRACQRLNWDGDVRLIFEYLDVDVSPGQRTLSYKELTFLDSWIPTSCDEDHETELFCNPAKSSSSLSLSRRSGLRRTKSSPVMMEINPDKISISNKSLTMKYPMSAFSTPKIGRGNSQNVRTQSDPTLPNIEKPERKRSMKTRRRSAELEMLSGRVIALVAAPP